MKVEQVRPQQKPERKLSLKRKKTKLKTLTTDEQMQLDVVPGNTGTESEKAKTFRIARFLSQKLSGLNP